jgi:oligoendopeptidase F
MDYMGYNIGIHELGHNVEQVLSLNRVDHTLLRGVPNNAFTEALAFVFQARDLELLGLAERDAHAEALDVLATFWNTFEIAGVSLVDVDVWHWMYGNPDASPAELREATLRIARDVWNRYYAPVFGQRDSPLLGIYSHMISYPLYLADYPLGHMIALQIRQQMERAGTVGPEFVRMAVTGNVLPDLWMREATGAPVGPEALLAATAAALERVAP